MRSEVELDRVLEPRPARGEIALAISNLLLALLRDYTGRGARQARTDIGDDLITVVMTDTLTKGERSLVAAGKGEHVRHTRRLYQDMMCADAVAGVERLTGRRVIAFLSDNHMDPDLAVETFVLEPVVPAQT